METNDRLEDAGIEVSGIAGSEASAPVGDCPVIILQARPWGKCTCSRLKRHARAGLNTRRANRARPATAASASAHQRPPRPALCLWSGMFARTMGLPVRRPARTKSDARSLTGFRAAGTAFCGRDAAPYANALHAPYSFDLAHHGVRFVPGHHGTLRFPALLVQARFRAARILSLHAAVVVVRGPKARLTHLRSALRLLLSELPSSAEQPRGSCGDVSIVRDERALPHRCRKQDGKPLARRTQQP